jgi:inorganic pyrophosphatase
MTGMAHSRPSDSARESRTIDVVVEIPRGSRNKYEYDHHRGVMRLDRRLFSATVYPADYGFIPDTLGLDGDPLDALVLLEDPTFPGCWVESRPVGMLVMHDEAGEDAKIICVPPHDPRWDGIKDLTDLSASFRAEIKHFFDVYKLIEPGKESTTGEFEGRDAAWNEIEAAIARAVSDPSG